MAREFGLGVFKFNDAGLPSYDISVDLDADEYERYFAAALEVQRIGSWRTRDVVERNYRELQSLRSYYTHEFSMRRPREAMLGHEHAAMGLIRAMVNWLTSFRLFLDHHETELNRRFGESSSQFIRFKRATNSAFDAPSNGYRFMSKFRNYVQHCGLPFHRVRSELLDPATGQRQVAFVVDRDRLLADYREWGAIVGPELAAGPDEIDVLSLVDDAMRGLRAVAEVVARINIEALLDQAGPLREAIDRLELSVGETPLLAHVTGRSAEGLSFSHLWLLGASDVERLEAALRSEDPPAVLLPQPVEEGQSPPPIYTQGNVHELDRAIAVMTRWFEEGRLNRGFYESVRDLLAEDGGNATPIVSGLVTLLGFALGMAGAASGTTAEDILGKFIEGEPALAELVRRRNQRDSGGSS